MNPNQPKESENFLSYFKNGAIFDVKNDESKWEGLNMEYEFDYPIFSLSKKKFVSHLIESEFSTSIYGDLKNSDGTPRGFTFKMAMLIAYADIKNNLKKFKESRETIEHILENSDISLNQDQYIMLLKLESINNAEGQFTKYIINKEELENNLKSKYSLYELHDMCNPKNLIVRTLPNQAKHEYTVDMFSNETINEKLGNKNAEHNEFFAEVINKPSKSAQFVLYPIPINQLSSNVDDIVDQLELNSDTLSIKEKSQRIITYLSVLSTTSNSSDGVEPPPLMSNNPIEKQMALNTFAALSNQLLTISDKFDMSSICETLIQNGVLEVADIKKALDLKFNQEGNQKLTIDDLYTNGRPNNTVYYSVLIGNNESVIQSIAQFKNNEKLEHFYKAYLTPTLDGESNAFSLYLDRDTVNTDFDNSFSKPLSSSRSMRHIIAKIAELINVDDYNHTSTYDKILNRIVGYKDKEFNGYDEEEWTRLFAIAKKNDIFIDELDEKMNEVVASKPELGVKILSTLLDNRVLDRDVASINRVLDMIKAQEKGNPQFVDKDFIKSSYKLALSLPESILSDLKVSQKDIDDFDLDLTKKQINTIKTLKF